MRARGGLAAFLVGFRSIWPIAIWYGEELTQ
jgi:hypothetical protein